MEGRGEQERRESTSRASIPAQRQSPAIGVRRAVKTATRGGGGGGGRVILASFHERFRAAIAVARLSHLGCQRRAGVLAADRSAILPTANPARVSRARCQRSSNPPTASRAAAIYPKYREPRRPIGCRRLPDISASITINPELRRMISRRGGVGAFPFAFVLG